MKQEHRLVAELYRFVAPFVDTTRDVYISPDGQAVRTAVAAGRFTDAGLPDLWFTIIGQRDPLLVEAKVLEDDQVRLMQSQLLAWKSAGASAYKPRFWVAVDRTFKEFYFWSHADFLPVLDACTSTRDAPYIRPPGMQKFDSVSALALHVLREA
jgi:hypothetical protein